MKLSMGCTVLAAVIAVTASVPALSTEKTEGGVATVNGIVIPARRADALIAAEVAQGQSDSEQLRNEVRDNLVRGELIAQEAQKQGLDKKAEVQAQMELARQGVLIRAYMQEFVRSHPIREDSLKKEYEALKAQLGDKEYKVRHILVDHEVDAMSIIAKLKAGEQFEALAMQSKDPGSKNRGGDLGWAAPSNFVRPFSEAVIALEKGKFTEAPVKTDFGYHVIRLDDTREQKVPAMDDVKPQLVQRLQQELVTAHLADLRKKAKVE